MVIYSASAGTGKTYTLAARYIALLMDSPGDRGYRRMLAVTFTNKATAEMKRRILSWLYRMGGAAPSGFPFGEDGEYVSDDGAKVKDFMGKVRGFMRSKLDGRAMAEKASRLYHNILEEYDEMRVSTIDAFLQQLITGMAHMLGIGADFGVEVDSDHVVSTAVDEVIQEQDCRPLDRYLEERLDEEKGWDVRRNLIDMTSELLREAVLKDGDDIVLDPERIAAYKKATDWHGYSGVKRMRVLYDMVKDCERDGAISGGRNYYAFIRRVGNTFNGGLAKEDDAFRPLGRQDYERLASAGFLDKVQGRTEIQQCLLEMQELCAGCRRAYLTWKISTLYLNDLAMMSFVKGCMDRNLTEANAILLARSAYVLQAALKPGDADFILEKAGIRYRHIMIDEFQDTSTLQWAVFEQLICEVLASGGTTLIVGDVKQSIYRWRNGDYRIMQGLMSEESGARFPGVFREAIETKTLRKNFRSQARVVEFNYKLFEYIREREDFANFAGIYDERECDENGNYIPFNLADYCSKADMDAGYVQVKILPFKSKSDDPNLLRKNVRAQIVRNMFADIDALLTLGAAADDVLILVRKKSEAREILAQYAGSGLEARGLRLCSNDSFVLESSQSVRTVVNAMKLVCTGDKIAAMYLRLNGIPTDGLDGSLMQLPLGEMLERIVNLTLFDSSGRLRYPDTPYLNCLVDEVSNFVVSYGSSLRDFLVYWDDQLHNKAIPASGSEGVRIMTIHSAKGLERKYVFVPFCDWELEEDRYDSKLWHKAVCESGGAETLGLIPAARKGLMRDTAYSEAYEVEHNAQKVDNLNLLYVAFTRAADHLYVYADVRQSDKDTKQTVGTVLQDYIAADSYECGEKTIVADNAAVDDTPFEHRFTDDERVGYTFCSSESAISFRQSQESMLYMERGADEAGRVMSRIDAGNLRHDIFAQINTMADTPKVIARFYAKGLIGTEAEAEAIGREINLAWQEGQMADWFGGGWRVMREVAILRPQEEYEAETAEWKKLAEGSRGPMPKRELRPDRVMLRDGKAVVLDFKFGRPDHAKYSKQVKAYVDMLRRMGYDDVTGYLWYGNQGKLERII